MAKKRRYVHRRDAQPNILRAAIELFGRDGRNVTTRALAKAAGTHGPLLYTWFENKENLYLQAVTHVVNQANKGFTDFALKVFGGSEQAGAEQIAEALRSWYAAIPRASARLLVQVLINDDMRTSAAHETLDQLVNALAKVVTQMHGVGAKPAKKTARKLNAPAAAKTLVRALLLGKITVAKSSEQDMEETIQQWLQGLAPSRS
jgi:AcrR family transcriptional regulator